MDSFEEEVQYFTELVFNNIQRAKTKKKGKFEAVFFNVNVRLDGKEIAVYNQKKDICYDILTKDIEEFNFEHYITKHLALYYIDKLTKYSNNQISFEEVAGINKNETPKIVSDILKQKDNIIEQLRLLSKNSNIHEVQEYIDRLYNDTYASEYLKYLIKKYYYNKKDIKRVERNGLEKMYKLLLH